MERRTKRQKQLIVAREARSRGKNGRFCLEEVDSEELAVTEFIFDMLVNDYPISSSNRSTTYGGDSERTKEVKFEKTSLQQRSVIS